MADGKIRIETKLDNSKLKADVKELNSMVSRCASGIKNLFKPPSQNELKNQIKSLNQSLKENERFIKDNEKQIQSYQDRLNNLDSEKAISSIQKMIDSANNNIEKGKSKIDEYQRKLDEIDIKKSVIIEEVVQNNRIGMNDTDVVVDKRVETSLSENKNYQKLISQEQELVNKMNEYSSSVRNAENNVNVLNQTLSNTKDTLKTDFSRSINDLSNSNTAAIEKSSQLSSAIEKLKAKVNSTKKVLVKPVKNLVRFFLLLKKVLIVQ